MDFNVKPVRVSLEQLVNDFLADYENTTVVDYEQKHDNDLSDNANVLNRLDHKRIKSVKSTLNCVLKELCNEFNIKRVIPFPPDQFDTDILALTVERVKTWVLHKFKLLSPASLNVRVNLLKKFLQFVSAYMERTANTLSNYGGGNLIPNVKILQVCNYVKSECIDSKKHLDSYNTKITKRLSYRHHMNQLAERKRLLTKDDIRAFETSAYTRNIVDKILRIRNSDSQPEQITQKFAVAARNVLLCLILYRSVQRSGCLGGMTVGEFLDGETCGQNFIISIQAHKTFHIYGFARIVLENWLHTAMEIYLHNLRPLTCGDLARTNDLLNVSNKKAPFFVTTKCTPLDNGYVSTAIASSWKKADMKKKFGSVTNFRKSIVSLIWSENVNMRSDLASLMGHRISTSEKFYNNVFLPNHQAIQTVGQIKQCLLLKPINNSFDTQTGSVEETSANVEHLPCVPIVSDAKIALVSPMKQFKSVSTQTDFNECAKTSNLVVQASCTSVRPEIEAKKHGRRTFDRNDANVLITHPEIQRMIDNEMADSAVLRQLLATDEKLKVLASKYTVKQIRDKIRSVYRTKAK